jgi:uncharacterized protein (TIRG00374 family)
MSSHEKSPNVFSQRLMIGIVIGLALLGVFLVAMDWHQAHHVLRRANWEWISAALLFTTISYLCLSYGFMVASHMFGIHLGHGDLLRVGFISNVLNNVVSAGGAAGYSIRLIIMKRRGQTTADILAASVFHSYFNTLALLTLLPLGLFHLLTTHPLSSRDKVGIGVAFGVALLVLTVVTALVFSSAIRAMIFRRLRALWQRLTRRDLEASLRNLDSTLRRGMTAIRTRPASLLFLLILVTTDWISSLITLGFCFRALGTSLTPGVLVTGFAIGVAAGLASMVPGGLGIQDGSMTGVYALLGVPLEQAVLASVLFRVVYYIIPFLVSLAFYWRLLHGADANRQATP